MTELLFIDRDEVSRLQNAWYAAKEEATTFKNQAEKRSGLQQEIVDLTESNEQLKQQIEANNNSVQPLRARREELSRHSLPFSDPFS